MPTQGQRDNFYRRQAIEVWESFTPYLRSKLDAVDYMLRQIVSEMRASRATSEVIADYLPAAFAELWADVARKNDLKLGRAREWDAMLVSTRQPKRGSSSSTGTDD